MTKANNEGIQSRKSRESETHAKQTRRQPWRPVRKLETPPAPEGYEYRWIRESMLGQEDKANVARRIREGWELVRGTDLPAEYSYPTADTGRHAGRRADGWTDDQTDVQRQTDGQKVRVTETETDRQADRQTSMQTDR